MQRDICKETAEIAKRAGKGEGARRASRHGERAADARRLRQPTTIRT